MSEALANLGRSGTLWSPRASQIAKSEMAKFIAALGGAVTDYETFHAWSASDLEGFWGAFWFFARVIGDPGSEVLAHPRGGEIAAARFFPGARLNLAQNMLRGAPERLAVRLVTGRGEVQSLTLAQVLAGVADAVARLRALGVGPGDLVLARMPNRQERLLACLACFHLGAVWALVPDGVSAAQLAALLAPLRPRLLIADTRRDTPDAQHAAIDAASALIAALAANSPATKPAAFSVLTLGVPVSVPAGITALGWSELSSSALLDAPQTFAFDHPAVMLITPASGPDGPHAHVHSAGAVLLTHLKEHVLHGDLRRGDVLFWASGQTPMQWHWQMSVMACQAVPVLVEEPAPGSDPALIWARAQQLDATQIGFDLGIVRQMMGTDYMPCQHHDLWRLRSLFLECRSPEPGVFEWVYANIKSNMMLAPLCGTEAIFGHYCLGSPLHPVREGEMTAVALGMSLHVLDRRGVAVVGEQGDLIVSEPFPSVPLARLPGSGRGLAPWLDPHPGVWTARLQALRTAYGSMIITWPTPTLPEQGAQTRTQPAELVGTEQN